MVRFTELDGYLLWCLPDPGCDLANLIRTYMFVNRDAAPSYMELADCLRRSVLAGVVLPPVGEHYRLSPEWLPRVRRWDDWSATSEEGMIAFAEWLSSGEWPVVCPDGHDLSREQYEVATVGRPKRL